MKINPPKKAKCKRMFLTIPLYVAEIMGFPLIKRINQFDMESQAINDDIASGISVT